MGYNFKQDLEKAEVSEMKFYDMVKGAKGYEVRDVRYIKEYQDIDVDFVLVRTKTGEEINIEIKSDDGIAKWGNVLLEEVSNRYINSDGWWRKTQAKWLLFYMPQKGYFYKLKVDDISEYLKLGQYQTKNVFNSVCKLINIDKFCKWKGIELDSLIFMQENKREVA